jgi:hypothetical protein
MRKLLMMLLTIIVQPFTRGCQQYASITLANATEPSLLAGLLVDALGKRLAPSNAVRKGRRYRYCVAAALITEAGTDRARPPGKSKML